MSTKNDMPERLYSSPDDLTSDKRLLLCSRDKKFCNDVVYVREDLIGKG